MFAESLIIADETETSIDDVKEPNDDDVEKRVQSLRRQASLEKAIARKFFSSCVPGGTFADLRKVTRQDYEISGNAYWEVLRGNDGRPRTLVFVPSSKMRLGKADPTEVTVKIPQKVTDITWETVKIKRTFKRFTQLNETGQPRTWFKELGDPRIMSRKTGTYYSTLTSMVKSEGKAVAEATEILHFDLTSLASQYGIPRYSGNIPAVLGSRELDETNLDYFLSNAVPALALLCAGGRFAKGVDEKLKEFFTEEVRGRRSTHKLVVLEAEVQRRAQASGASAVPRIEFVPLRNAQMQDAMFLNYDERNTKKVNASFRLPASLTGSSKFSLSDLRFAEEQVYQPERDTFDDKINNNIMPLLRVTFWAFKSNATAARDPEVIGDLTISAAREGLIIPAEARGILSEILGKDFPVIDELWANQPLPLTIAALTVKAGPAEAVREQGRQDGNPAPIERLLQELGLAPDQAAAILEANTGGEGDTQITDDQATSTLSALAALRSMGAKFPGASGSE
jgi:capsid portal protein